LERAASEEAAFFCVGNPGAQRRRNEIASRYGRLNLVAGTEARPIPSISVRRRPPVLPDDGAAR